MSLSPAIEQTIGDHLTLSVCHNYQRLTIDEGRLFTANVSNIGLKYQFNKRTFVRTILQYSDYDRNVEYYNDDDVEPVSRTFSPRYCFHIRSIRRRCFSSVTQIITATVTIGMNRITSITA